ncbi:helix-turn-helix transcriptional regulator [Andreprevotia chitinilytica]|uniref:helix-turn-helix transcriptional regulator n=1 Tax=Andreprevotia chitinilytica TaxID=396808 RepID=UPI000554B82F|nr:helix-turn-helix transcriptional regulator [Andreprevotia chitinilytica]
MDREYNAVVEQIYASIQDDAALTNVAGDIARMVGGYVGQYISIEPGERQIFRNQISDPALQDSLTAYADYFVAVDPRLQWFTGGACGEWRADQVQFDDRYIRNSELYNDFLKPWGARRVINSCLLKNDAGICEALAIARPWDGGDFTAHDIQLLDSLSSHLVRAAQLRARLRELEAQQIAAQTSLAHLPYGALWLDAMQGIAWLSPAANAYLAQSDGLKVRNHRLHCSDANVAHKLAAALQRATAGQGRQGSWLSIPRTRQTTPWLVSVIPASLPTEFGPRQRGPYALVIVQDGAGPGLPHPKQLELFFGLTPAEARLAQGLLQNETLESYAERHHVSRNTVKTHLTRLFAKTGTRRQAELLRTLSLPLPAQNSPPPFQ